MNRLIGLLLTPVIGTLARDHGTHTVHWNGRDDAGNAVATGGYFLQVQSEEWRIHRKIVLLK